MLQHGVPVRIRLSSVSKQLRIFGNAFHLLLRVVSHGVFESPNRLGRGGLKKVGRTCL
jgi:hypothetical protein